MICNLDAARDFFQGTCRSEDHLQVMKVDRLFSPAKINGNLSNVLVIYWIFIAIKLLKFELMTSSSLVSREMVEQRLHMICVQVNL